MRVADVDPSGYVEVALFGLRQELPGALRLVGAILVSCAAVAGVAVLLGRKK